jgi:hypothetical protein
MYNKFDFFFNQESHCEGLVREFRFTLYAILLRLKGLKYHITKKE